MADDSVWYSAANIPADFPTHDDIVEACTLAGYKQNGVCVPVAGKPRFWVKYGNHALMRAEGRTQAYVAGIVNSNPASTFRVPEVYLGFSRGWCGYIVMDFVQGATLAERKSPKGNYDGNDLEAAAAAFQQLIEIKMPAGTAPGPVGGGYIGHDFFFECLSTLEYSTVAQLEKQINTILRPFGKDFRVDLQTETADGLVLCPSDPHPHNFMVDDEGMLWVIDFGRTCFLPSSFVSYSLTRSMNGFVQNLARRVKYPPSANLQGMGLASGRLVITGNNAWGTRFWRPPSGFIKHSDRQVPSKV